MKFTKNISDFKLDNQGFTEVTAEIQKAINLVASKKGRLIINPGCYLVSSLFLESDMEFILEAGATLLATTNEESYPIAKTRVAGIEMDWYLGILNCINKKNVLIEGAGKIAGNGPYWWHKYWGSDQKGGMRRDYDAKGLRFACDYDCLRPRNLLVSGSSNIKIKGITLAESGFWNLHILYSENILVEAVKIDSAAQNSPSTDGIDIDSSSNVVIRGCITNCNDDSICIKSGRDADGLRVNRPASHITIEDCVIKKGFGITIGSEVSGGISDVTIKNISYYGTDCGFRIKSALPRGGYIKNIYLENLNLVNVKYLLHFYLNWNPDYSICKLPLGYEGEIKPHWQKLLMPSKGIEAKTKVEGIRVKNVKATYEPNYEGISRVFNIVGYSDLPIKDLFLENWEVLAKEYGLLEHLNNLNLEAVNLSITGSYDAKNDQYDNR